MYCSSLVLLSYRPFFKARACVRARASASAWRNLP